MFDFLGDAWDYVKKNPLSVVFPVPYAANLLAAHALGLGGGDDVPTPDKIPAPPPPPDLTDTAVQQARLSARRRALLGAGIGSTFLSGPLGDLAPPPTQSTSLGGV